MELYSKEKLDKIEEQIQSCENILIIAHQSPDGDALGSLMAMKYILSNKGKKAIGILPDPVPDFIQWLDEEKSCLVYKEQETEVTDALEKADLIIVLDFNAPHRAGNGLGTLIKDSKAFKIMMDHHPFPEEDAFDCCISDIGACATAEVIGKWLMASDQTELIDEKVAEALYLGLVTDSGSFRFSSVTSKTHELAGILLKTGIQHSEIHEKTFDQNELGRMRLLGYALSKKLVKVKNHKAAYISLNENELKKYYATKGDTEGLVNYALSLKGVSLAAFFKEQEGMIKISFRSTGTRAVNEMASKFFNGGGHLNAAGGRYQGTIDEALSKFEEVLNDEKY